eukprot:TRINITY_DN1562_c0_g1_i5.p2 TRINITY_DN1562_c0_g1~~TRINITY_DN1562_c0_g1_i5.p2  ORF type:complete len:106 (+),score=15.67 TRINITY_DN1562_c0_g1_i5:118-435(+)
MSRSSRKHVTRNALEAFPVPDTAAGQLIASVVGNRGANIIEVCDPNRNAFLCRVPSKFNKLIWIKRGGHVIVLLDQNIDEDVKVRGEVLHVLQKDQIKHLKKINM